MQKHELESLPVLVAGKPAIAARIERAVRKAEAAAGRRGLETVLAQAEADLEDAVCDLYGLSAAQRSAVVAWHAARRQPP
ncbi:MAG: hypothetical protein HY744_30990 [Deltaproteobacteria bacterium]|nr:hypothetical protein [Deltaproteobacteria bacterium]